jgi:two-component system phosphate regulon sensor histidine kinase PhoR
VLERSFYRKIKLIYKFIYQTKATKKEETYYKYLLPQKSIDEVREEVEAWAEENKQEIELLRKTNNSVRSFCKIYRMNLKPCVCYTELCRYIIAGCIGKPEVNKRFLEKNGKKR